MTDPTSYAAGIEAAARVAEDRHTFWNSSEEHGVSCDVSACQDIAAAIRALAPERGGGSGDVWRSNYQNAWSALQMIRETVEAVCPAGALPSQEAVLGTRGPEPVHEAEAICEAIATLSPAPPAAPSGWREALEFISEEHDAGRHDGLPEPCPAHDAETMFAVARKALAAAPPPPVPVQAESGEVERVLDECVGAPRNGDAAYRVRVLAERYQNQAETIANYTGRIRELEGQLRIITDLHNRELARNCELDDPTLPERIRELEGEVARAKRERETWVEQAGRNAVAADRLTLAAQAAQDALEPFAIVADGFDDHKPLPVPDDCLAMQTPIIVGDLRRAREALASLASVLEAKPS